MRKKLFEQGFIDLENGNRIFEKDVRENDTP